MISIALNENQSGGSEQICGDGELQRLRFTVFPRDLLRAPIKLSQGDEGMPKIQFPLHCQP
jgi:hypothetical protein